MIKIEKNLNDTNDLERLFAALVVNRQNMQMLHWNVIGSHFDCAHKLFDDYISKFSEYVDATAEMLKMLELRPLDIRVCIDILEHDVDHNFMYLHQNTDYSADQAFVICTAIFKDMLCMYDEIIAGNLPEDIKSELQAQQYWFRLEGMYKGVARNK